MGFDQQREHHAYDGLRQAQRQHPTSLEAQAMLQQAMRHDAQMQAGHACATANLTACEEEQPTELVEGSDGVYRPKTEPATRMITQRAYGQP